MRHHFVARARQSNRGVAANTRLATNCSRCGELFDVGRKTGILDTIMVVSVTAAMASYRVRGFG